MVMGQLEGGPVPWFGFQVRPTLHYHDCYHAHMPLQPPLTEARMGSGALGRPCRQLSCDHGAVLGAVACTSAVWCSIVPVSRWGSNGGLDGGMGGRQGQGWPLNTCRRPLSRLARECWFATI